MTLEHSILILDACVIALAGSHVAMAFYIARLFRRLVALELTVFSIPSTSALIDSIIEHKEGGGIVETKVR